MNASQTPDPTDPSKPQPAQDLHASDSAAPPTDELPALRAPVRDYEPRWGEAGVFLLLLLPPILWLLAKPLLHGQLGWLVWLPLLTFVATLLILGFTRGMVGNLAVIAAFLTTLVLGPALAKWHQLQDEERYVAAVRDAYSDAQVLSADELVDLGWDACWSLDKARDAPENTFPRNAPHDFVAETWLRAAGADAVKGKTRNGVLAQVRLADEHLC